MRFTKASLDIFCWYYLLEILPLSLSLVGSELGSDWWLWRTARSGWQGRKKTKDNSLTPNFILIVDLHHSWLQCQTWPARGAAGSLWPGLTLWRRLRRGWGEERKLERKWFSPDISSVGYCDQDLSLDVDEELQENEGALKKSLRSMSRSTFDSIIDDYIENDWEKKSAFGVSLTVMIIVTTFLFLLFSALSVSLGVQHGNQSRKIAFDICSKERKTDLVFLHFYSELSVPRLGISGK